MKITNVSANRIYLSDLRLSPEAQTVGRRGEDRYLHPGDHAYLSDTGEVLRSISDKDGTLRRWAELGVITLNDEAVLAASAGFVISHGFGYIPTIIVVKKVGSTWVDATGTYDLVHNADFTVSTVRNATDVSLDLLIRCG